MPYSLLGLALIGGSALLVSRPSSRPVAPRPHIDHGTLTHCGFPVLPPDDELLVEEADDIVTVREPTDEERELVHSTLTILQRALEHDDGIALTTIAHSTGMIFWSTHAELVPPAAGVSADRPSTTFAASYFPTTYRRDLLAKLGRALPRIELEASDEHDACDARPPARARLTAGLVPDDTLAHGVVTDHLDPVVETVPYPSALRLRTYGLEIFFGIEHGRALVTHIVESDPCDVSLEP